MEQRMLKNEIRNNSLYREVQDLIGPMGYTVVDVVRNDTAGGIQMNMSIACLDRDITTDDLEEVYNIVYPRYQTIFKSRDLSLEVSSPGLQRNFKDVYEFTIFEGKLVKLYTSKYSSNVEGVIASTDDEGVTLENAIVQDTEEKMDSLRLTWDEIQKAKLSYRWEEKQK